MTWLGRALQEDKVCASVGMTKATSQPGCSHMPCFADLYWMLSCAARACDLARPSVRWKAVMLASTLTGRNAAACQCLYGCQSVVRYRCAAKRHHGER